MSERKNNKFVPLITKLLAIILLMGVSVFLFSVAPDFKATEKFQKGVLRMVVDDKDVTNGLPDPVLVEDDVVMISKDTAMKYFDDYIYVYYDEKYDTAIITSDDKVIKIKLEGSIANVNGEDKIIKGTAKFIENELKDGSGESYTKKSLYIPISSIQEYIDIEFCYDEKVIATTPLGWSRSKVVLLSNKIKLKAYKKDLSLTNGVGYSGEEVYLFDTEEKESGDYLVVRNKRGDIGYCKFYNIDGAITRLNQGAKVVKYKNIVDEVKFTLVWEYAQNGTPNRSGQEAIKRINIVSPTWIEVKDSDCELSDTIDKDYISWAKSNGYRLWPMLKNDFISMESLDGISTIMHDMKLREKLINNVVKLALDYGFDGINLDFENMYKDDKNLYSQFVREFSSTLRANNLISSVDVTVAGGSDTYSLCFDRTAIAKAADFVMLMAYDQNSNWSPKPGPTASLSWVKSNVEEMLGYEQVPKDKLFLCVPFYYNDWVVQKDDESSKKLYVSYISKASNDLEKYKDDAVWSDEDGQYYIKHDNGDGTIRNIWVENEDSLKKKIELINEYDLAGVAVWRWGYEKGNSLWNVIEETMNKQ